VSPVDPYATFLRWWYARSYAPALEESRRRLPTLRQRVHDPVVGAQVLAALNEVLLGIDLMEELRTHEPSTTFRFATLDAMWGENRRRLMGALGTEEATAIVGRDLDTPRVARKAMAIAARAKLQLYPPHQLAQLVAQREPGRWVPPPPPARPRRPSPPPPPPSAAVDLTGTFYEILGVSLSASPKELKASYRALALRHHPDRNLDGDRAQAERIMSAITEAYDVLSNPDLRSRYDLTLRPPTIRAEQAPPRRPPPADACMVCGHGPVAVVTLRGETGMLLARRRTRIAGPLCRHCGIAMFRTVQNKTLITGWWGVISFFANVGSILANLGVLLQLRSLPPAEPIAHDYATPFPAPLHPGRPLWHRSGIWVAALALVIVTLVAAHHGQSTATPGSSGASSAPAGTSQGSTADPFTKGTCLSTSGNAITGVVPCSEAHGAKVLDTAQDASGCPSDADKYFTEKPSDPTPGLVVCLSTSQ